MKGLFKYLAVLVCLSNALNAVNSNADVHQGNVIYTYESGKMQCLSEIDDEGHIWILIKSLDDITTVNFNKIGKYKGSTVIALTMKVEDRNAPCASWINLQEVKIAINPVKVEKTTLNGKKVYEKGNYTVMEG